MGTDNRTYGSLVFGFIALALAALVPTQPLHAQDSRARLGHIVNIQIHDGMIEPGDINVPSGTTVVWLNRAGVPVKVRFMQQTVGTTCKAPLSFRETWGGALTSSSLGNGEAASVCLLEPNRYTYEVDGVTAASAVEGGETNATLRGVVTVK